MEDGLCKDWTPEVEEHFNKLLTRYQTFAEQHMTMLLRDALKYDGRSKEGKRAMVQARLRLATATDEDLRKLAHLQTFTETDKPGEIPNLRLHMANIAAERLVQLKKERDEIREKGITGSELKCQ